MNLEFKSIRIVGGVVIADHDTLPSIDVTRYLSPKTIDNLMAREAIRQIAEQQEERRATADQYQAEALYENAAKRGDCHVSS